MPNQRYPHSCSSSNHFKADEMFVKKLKTARPQKADSPPTRQYQRQRAHDFGKHSGIKDFLNGRLYRKKPIYVVERRRSTNSYMCRLSVGGMEHVAVAEAANKRDAENKAAWNYCEHLIERGMINEFELPMRPPSLGGISESEIKVRQYAEESAGDIYDHGDWVRENSVKRLTQFCAREDCCADYKQYTTKLAGYKTFICDLTLRVSSVQKVVIEQAKDSPDTGNGRDGLCMNFRPVEYSCRESGPTKEVANELCSLSMVRMLFAEGLIERFGQTIKGELMGDGPPPIPVMPSIQETTEPIKRTPTKVKPPSKVVRTATRAAAHRSRIEATQRKLHENEMQKGVEEDLEHGGWILSNSLQRLNQFVQFEHCECQFTPLESEPDTPLPFTHQIYLNVFPVNKEYFFTAKENRKKLAKTTCAMRLVRKLFAEGFIERFGQPLKRMWEVTRNTTPPVSMSVTRNEAKRSSSRVRPKQQESIRRRTSPIKTPTRPTYHARSSPLKRKADTEPEVSAQSKKKRVKTKKPKATESCITHASSSDRKAVSIPKVSTRPKRRRVRIKKPKATGNCITHASSPDGKAVSIPKGETNLTSDLFSPPIYRTRNLSVILDEYMNEQHNELCPTNDELQAVREAVEQTQLIFSRTDEELRMRKGICDTFMEGIVLIGDGGKELLFRHDLNVEMVVYCEKVPTKQYFHFVAYILSGKLEEWGKEITSSCKLEADSDKAAFVLYFNIHDTTNVLYEVTVTVYMTSKAIRVLQKENQLQQLPENVLDPTKCLKVLSQVRRANWFKACTGEISVCKIVIRILRDMKKRIKGWQALDDWALELLVNNVYKTSLVPISSLTSLLEQTFQRIANGMFISNNCRMLDPCEDEQTDVIQHMTAQERKDLTDVAQAALNHLRCCEPHKILQIKNE